MAPSHPAGPGHLLLFEKWMDTTKWLLERTQRFPRALRHTLTDRIESLTLQFLELVTQAAYRRDRAAPLREANDVLNRLRVLLRVAHELKVLSGAQYEEVTTRLSEAGKMLGAWMRPASVGDDSGGEVTA